MITTTTSAKNASAITTDKMSPACGCCIRDKLAIAGKARMHAPANTDKRKMKVFLITV